MNTEHQLKPKLAWPVWPWVITWKLLFSVRELAFVGGGGGGGGGGGVGGDENLVGGMSKLLASGGHSPHTFLPVGKTLIFLFSLSIVI